MPEEKGTSDEGGKMTVRQVRRRVENLERFRRRVQMFVNAEPELAVAGPLMLGELGSALARWNRTLEAQEREDGCRHCGAQEGEDCRLDDCLMVEEARAASDAEGALRLDTGERITVRQVDDGWRASVGLPSQGVGLVDHFAVDATADDAVARLRQYVADCRAGAPKVKPTFRRAL